MAKANLKIILGLGKTGLACAKFLAKHNENILVMDTREDPPGLAELKNLLPHVPVILGRLDQETLNNASELILSPGLAKEEPLIAAQVLKGVPIYGDIELFARHAKAPIAAITGSNAKSTVTT